MRNVLASVVAALAVVTTDAQQPVQFLSKGDGRIYPHGRLGDPFTAFDGWDKYVPITQSLDGKYLFYGVPWDEFIVGRRPIVSVDGPTGKVTVGPEDLRMRIDPKKYGAGGAPNYRRPFTLVCDRGSSLFLAQLPETNTANDRDQVSLLMKLSQATLKVEGVHAEPHGNGISTSVSNPCPQFGVAYGPEDGKPVTLIADPGDKVDVPRLAKDLAAYWLGHGVRLRVHDHRPTDKRTGKLLPVGFVGQVSLVTTGLGDPPGTGGGSNWREWDWSSPKHKEWWVNDCWINTSPVGGGPDHDRDLFYTAHEVAHSLGRSGRIPDEYLGSQFSRKNPHLNGSPGNLMGQPVGRSGRTDESPYYPACMNFRPDQVAEAQGGNTGWFLSTGGLVKPEVLDAIRNMDPVVRQLAVPDTGPYDFACGPADGRRVRLVSEDPLLSRDDRRWVQQAACDRLLSWGAKTRWYDHRPYRVSPKGPFGKVPLVAVVRIIGAGVWPHNDGNWTTEKCWIDIGTLHFKEVWASGRSASRSREAVLADALRGACRAMGVPGVNPNSPTDAQKAALRTAVNDKWMGRDKAPEFVDSQLY